MRQHDGGLGLVDAPLGVAGLAAHRFHGTESGGRSRAEVVVAEHAAAGHVAVAGLAPQRLAGLRGDDPAVLGGELALEEPDRVAANVP